MGHEFCLFGDKYAQVEDESGDVEIKSVDSSRVKSTLMGSFGLSVASVNIVKFLFNCSRLL